MHHLNINWDALTACGTIALAILTFYLAYAAINQLKDIRSSSVENIIMKQLEFHYKIVERMKIKEMKVREDPFKFMFLNFVKYYYSNNNINRIDDESIKDNISTAFQLLYNKYGNLLGHYYRNLYRTFKNINETKIKGFDKEQYSKLVRAQLSEFEILLLFYNCIWVGDEDKFKKLIEKHELLEGLNHSKLLVRDHSKLYLETAFGNDFL